jgi:hypothetical protein
MTFIIDRIQGQATTTAASPDRPLMDLKSTCIAAALMCAFFILVRSYEQMFGLKAGRRARLTSEAHSPRK